MKKMFMIFVLASVLVSYNLSFCEEEMGNASKDTEISEEENRRENIFKELREKMVEEQIKSRGIENPKVLEAMSNVKRHLFVPPQMSYMAYKDHPVPIGYKQTISQPYIVAYMTELLELEEDDKVLEIGTGSGYQAAILAELVREVYTIEIIKPLADQARKRLGSMGYINIQVKHGDGYKGWPKKAPFDAIMVTAAPDEIPESLIEQLKIGGKMIAPVGSYYQELYLVTKKVGGINKEKLIPVRFVPMVKGKD